MDVLMGAIQQTLHAQKSLIENEKGCKQGKVDGSLLCVKKNYIYPWIFFIVLKEEFYLIQ